MYQLIFAKKVCLMIALMLECESVHRKLFLFVYTM